MCPQWSSVTFNSCVHNRHVTLKRCTHSKVQSHSTDVHTIRSSHIQQIQYKLSFGPKLLKNLEHVGTLLQNMARKIGSLKFFNNTGQYFENHRLDEESSWALETASCCYYYCFNVTSLWPQQLFRTKLKSQIYHKQVTTKILKLHMSTFHVFTCVKQFI